MRSPKDSKGFILWGSWMPVQKCHSNLFYYWVHQQEGSVLNSTGLCPVCMVSLDFLFSHSMKRVCLLCSPVGGKNPLIPNTGILIGVPNTRATCFAFQYRKELGDIQCVYCLNWLVALRFKSRQYFSKHDDISRNKITVRKMRHVGSGKRWDNISCLWLDGIKVACWLLLIVGNNLTMYKYSRCTFSVSIVKYCQHQS